MNVIKYLRGNNEIESSDEGNKKVFIFSNPLSVSTMESTFLQVDGIIYDETDKGIDLFIKDIKGTRYIVGNIINQSNIVALHDFNDLRNLKTIFRRK